MPYDTFTLDGAALFDPENPQQRIVTYHFNIPERLTPLRQTFETVLGQVETDFPATSQDQVVVVAYYQISAVYTLIHRDTGAERLWQGSFNPRSRERDQVLAFRYMDRATFVDFTHARSQTPHVLQQLNIANDQQETVWTVGDLLSVVLTIQTTVRARHPVFARHPELLGHRQQQHGRRRAGRRARRRAVFRLVLE